MAKKQVDKIPELEEKHLKSFILLKERAKTIKTKIDIIRTYIIASVEKKLVSKGKVVITKGDYTVTVNPIESYSAQANAIELIRETPKFKKYEGCIETHTVTTTSINFALLIEDIENDLLAGKITPDEVSELVKTTTQIRVT